ncbi:MAG TPA: hypothetical protein VGE37_12710 [Archangium sp.]
MKVAPRDASLARDAMRLERELHPVDPFACRNSAESAEKRNPKPSPSVDLRPRKGPDPFSLLAEAPIEFRPVRLERTVMSKPKRTEPHFAIFDLIDAERKTRTG